MASRKNLVVGALIIALSLVVCLTGIPLLRGTYTALVVAVILQIYLPGYLLARTLGRAGSPNPIVRFIWTLACGLTLSICIGGIARFLSLPVPFYLIILHLLMLGLLLFYQPAATPTSTPWRLTRANLPLYLLVVLACAVTVGMGFSILYRYYGFEDDSIFVSLIDWVATHPTVRPQGTPIRTRQIGVIDGDVRMETDGWSYVEASWVWTSGVTASDLVYYDLAPLFIWAIPLAHFTLAYELTERESVGAWAAMALTIAGLLTFAPYVYNPSVQAFGAYALFHINVDRQASIALILPLALIAGLAYLRSFSKRDLVIAALGGFALTAMHPIIASIFVFSVGITGVLRWLAKPSWTQFRKLLPLAGVGLLCLMVTFIQRLVYLGLAPAPNLGDMTGVTAQRYTPQTIISLPNFPLLGNTYILNLPTVFYNPVIVPVVLAGLLFGICWRRSLAAQYVFGTTLLALIFFFTPGLTGLIDRIGSFDTLLIFIFMLPVALSLGMAVEVIARWLSRVMKPGLAHAIISLSLVGTVFCLLFEPFPIYGSARDQLAAYNNIRGTHVVQPSQEALMATLRHIIAPDTVSIFAVPADITSMVIEEVHGAMVTGGRDGGKNVNLAAPGDNRLFGYAHPPMPWLDSLDLQFLAKWKVDHIVFMGDATRLSQLLLQPERFKLVGSTAGYDIFEVEPNIQPDTEDAIYEQMNQVYSTLEQPRWGSDGFNLIMPGDVKAWKGIADQWRGIIAIHPGDERAQLGLAFTYTMMGQDTDALRLWQALNAYHPDVVLYADAVASTSELLSPAQDTIAPLIALLKSSNDMAQVLAARRLLTETFFYRLNHEQLQQIFAITDTDTLAWDRLATIDMADDIRKRTALLMDIGEWTRARAWLDSIPTAERTAADLVTQAAAELALGNVDSALSILQPATDPDQIVANVQMQPGRWQNNTAAQMYYLLVAERAQRTGKTADAQTAYRQAISAGSTIAAPYFLAQISPPDLAATLQNQAKAAWAKKYDGPLPRLESLLTIADTHSLYAMYASVAHGTDEHAIIARALYGNIQPDRSYAVQTWRVKVISPDSRIQYQQIDVPAQFVDGALVENATELAIAADLPALTPALVYIEPRYDNRVTASAVTVPVVLNRPDSITLPSDANQSGYQFGSNITLKGYSVEDHGNQIEAALYWETSAALSDDYHVFVHIVDANGHQVGGQDSVPVDNRYPTPQWRSGVVISDQHMIQLDKALLPGIYTIQIGLYRLGDNARLQVTSNGTAQPDNIVTIGHITR